MKESLQIILITYNRASHLQNTLKQLFCEKSPVKDFDFTVLDNKSTDNTEEVVREFMLKYPNIKYQKNKYNVGGNANFAKALEMANKDYIWIIADDDLFDFSNWSEVETAINNQEKIICVADYAFKNSSEKNKVEYQLLQMTFFPSIIYKTSILTNAVMRNVYENIPYFFPQLPPLISLINQNEKFYILNKPIVKNGMKFNTDASYNRGNNNSDIYPRAQKMTWNLGYANVLDGLHDKNLAKKCFVAAVPVICLKWSGFYNLMVKNYQNHPNFIEDVLKVLPIKEKIKLKLCLKFPFVLYFRRVSYLKTVFKIFFQ